MGLCPLHSGYVDVSLKFLRRNSGDSVKKKDQTNPNMTARVCVFTARVCKLFASVCM